MCVCLCICDSGCMFVQVQPYMYINFTSLFCYSEYTKFVLEALKLEDTVKNNERRDVTGWFALKPLIFGFI